MLLTTRPRRSTSAASYSDESATKIRQELDALRPDFNIGPASAQRRIEILRTLCRALDSDGQGNHVRDAFRHLQGFEVLLDFFSATAKASRGAQWASDDALVFRLLSDTLTLLTHALRDHWGNGKFFRSKAHDGGWKYLANALADLVDTEPTGNGGSSIIGVLDSLLACALDQNESKPVFSKSNGRGFDQTTLLTRVPNPQALCVLLEVWSKAFRKENTLISFVSSYPGILKAICGCSIHAQQAIHSSGILSVLIRQLDSSFAKPYLQELEYVAAILMRLGICNVTDAAYLYEKARSSKSIAGLLVKLITEEPVPAHVHFDLSLCNHSSIELPDLRKTFPPRSSSAGYTLSLWLQVTHFDPEAHTTIFGAFDSSQSCFLLVYIERDTHNLILQTSIASQRPSARFKSHVFETSRWYHIAIVHRRPKLNSSARASLYVDGEFVEQVKLQFPESPPPASSGHASEADRSRGPRTRPVQVFLGTPADLASHDGTPATASQWKLASAHMYGITLSDELIAVHKELGPRYFGNYQDCLGSFQTYKASAALNLRNETLHPGKEETSDIVSAIRSKASLLVPESQVLLSFSPHAMIDDDQCRNFDDSQLAHSLSRTAQRNLRLLSQGGRTPVAINGSTPSVGVSLATGNGTAILTGMPTIVRSLPLDKAAYSIQGAVAIGLSLVDCAEDVDSTIRALRILFGLISNNWRNSEAMERENGYGILALLLETKLKSIGNHVNDSEPSVLPSQDTRDESKKAMKEVLKLILEFVGYNMRAPENSVINNPLAYRVLLVDMDLWRSADLDVQELYFKQFAVFVKGSKHHLFNAKRLARMRILKKWLDVLKGDSLTKESLTLFITAFKQLFSVAPATDSMRALALYIAYALEIPINSTGLGLRHARSMRFPTIHNNSRPTSEGTAAADRSGADEVKGGSTAGKVSNVHPRSLGIAMLEMYADVICGTDTNVARKFARAVSSKWMLNLLSYESPKVTILATKIIARTIYANGRGYLDKFCTSKTGGPAIMKSALRRKPASAELWLILIALLFGKDVAKIDFHRPFDLPNLLFTFPSNEISTVQAEFLGIFMAVLQQSLKSAIQQLPDEAKPNLPDQPRDTEHDLGDGARARSLQQVALSQNSPFSIITKFLSDAHQRSQSFRDFELTSNFTQELIFILYPFIVSSDVVSAETELNSRDSALTFNGEDVVIRPISRNSEQGTSIVRTLPVEASQSLERPKASPLRRTSSYVLVTSFDSTDDPVTPQLSVPFSPKGTGHKLPESHNQMVQEILDVIIGVYIDHLFTRKEFAGIGLYKRLPPGFQEHQAYFASYILRNTLSQLGETIRLKQEYLTEPRVLTNLARFATHLREAVYEGWFIGGAEPALEFLAHILEHLQRPEIAQVKTVRLCSEIIGSIRWVVERIVLMRMSEVDASPESMQTIALLQKIMYWHNVIFFNEGTQPQFLRLFFYLLYMKLISNSQAVADNAATLWRILQVQQPGWREAVQSKNEEEKPIVSGIFTKILELDNNTFLSWLREHREKIGNFVSSQPAEFWEDYVKVENRRTEESARDRLVKRKERLRQWVALDTQNDDIIRRHEQSSNLWRANIFRQEHSKRLRSVQDEQDNRAFNQSSWLRMCNQLRRPCGALDSGKSPAGWQLDRTEGPNRMRIRLLPDENAHLQKYQGKEAATKGKELSLDMKQVLKNKSAEKVISPVSAAAPASNGRDASNLVPETESLGNNPATAGVDDEFEIVDEINDGADGFEDKNRKVMRSLERGDRVEHVCNTARIVGLEAVEAILIIGKSNLYMVDNYLVRSDNEIVNIWNAPEDERDPYLQLISGHHAKDGLRASKPTDTSHETRHWNWTDVLSISKRRFLFREVGIEIFFVDGQSFLLTMARPNSRDDLYGKLLSKAQRVPGSLTNTRPEDAWRLDLLRTPEDAPQTLGSRFSSVFSNNTSNLVTRRWLRGEISNFHYLMLINTMAGRTFNDLTQYPVFPWVLADYTSEELDLSNPNTFRDLTKPMGCQTFQREAEFQERYNTFAEMGDGSTPAFHYGTHYSSAMIVSSYLIRLPPFVQSYLLLQGGAFDHPDRMFYSIEKAWSSASRDNMTDVRELTPEFFCLPEMFVNINGYDFGSRQGTGGKIDNVVLPPWAKGDPRIFIAKHRAALESEYVSKHLHAWIDLVFGHKQTGEAALEATNVFHHLSYRGAKNLDEIQDPVERLATIGIIHNFGQTPLQIFQRPHPQREDFHSRSQKRLDALAESLTRLPFPVLEASDKIASIHWDSKREKLVAASPRMVFVPSNYDKFVEWGFIDYGIRFYASESAKLLGHFEHIHDEQVNAAIFADSRTLVTAARDSTVAVWNVTFGKAGVEMQLKTNFFGHRRPVNVMTASSSFSTLLTSDEDGLVIAWDLNRSDLVRVLVPKGPRIDAMAMNSINGWIVITSGPNVSVYTINGDLLLDQMISTEADDVIGCVVWYEGNAVQHSERNIFFTGHRRGVANAWAIDVMGGRWVLEHVKRLGHGEAGGIGGIHAASTATITSILPRDTKVYVGDDDGRLVSGTLTKD